MLLNCFLQQNYCLYNFPHFILNHMIGLYHVLGNLPQLLLMSAMCMQCIIFITHCLQLLLIILTIKTSTAQLNFFHTASLIPDILALQESLMVNAWSILTKLHGLSSWYMTPSSELQCSLQMEPFPSGVKDMLKTFRW